MVAVAERLTQVQEALMRLQTASGRLTPEAVVAAARDPQSILHPYFEWDDETAADAFRLDQARTLIRSVRLEITIETREIRCVGYVRDPSAEAHVQGYRGLLAIQSQDEYTQRTIDLEVERAAGSIARVRSVARALGREDEALRRLRALLE